MARRERISVTISSLSPDYERFKSTSISAECTPSGMLVELGSYLCADRPSSLPVPATEDVRQAGPPCWIPASEIPGRNSIEMVSVPSLNGGRNDLGSSASRDAGRSQPHKRQRRSRNVCWQKAQSSNRRLPAFSRFTSQESPWLKRRNLRQQVVAQHRRHSDGSGEAR